MPYRRLFAGRLEAIREPTSIKTGTADAQKTRSRRTRPRARPPGGGAASGRRDRYLLAYDRSTERRALGHERARSPVRDRQLHSQTCAQTTNPPIQAAKQGLLPYIFCQSLRAP